MYERNYNFMIRYSLKFRLLLIGLTLLLSFIQNSSAFATNPTIVGSVKTPGWASGVYISSSYAYVADSYSGVKVIDISNPRNPAIVDSFGNDPGLCISDVYISGTYAYMAADTLGLLIIDISNPHNPTIVGSVATPVRARGVYISGSYACVATWGGGLYMIDISNPRTPTIVGSVDIFWAYSVYVCSTYAYVASLSDGLLVIDISNPQTPIIVGSTTKKGIPNPDAFTEDMLAPKGVYVSGPIAYVADSDGLQIINIIDLKNPDLLASVAIPDGASDVYVSDSYAYVTAEGPSGYLYVIDVSMFTGNVPGADDPSVNISLNQSQFKAGDTMTVTLATTPGTGDNLWDIYVGLILPDSTLYFMTYEPLLGLSLDPIPARPLREIRDETLTILDIILPAGLPSGNWLWASVLAKPDLGEIGGQISRAPFTIIAEQPPVVNVTGTWRGTSQSSVFVVGSTLSFDFTANITQYGSALRGSLDVPGILAPCADLKGTIEGHTITFHDEGDKITFTGTVNGNSMSGTYTHPFMHDNGTWQATKIQ